jgi:hypothetical protein
MSTNSRGRTTAERGYGRAHQQRRAQLAPIVRSGRATCWRCGKQIGANEPWDLGHDDHDRSIYRGPECRRCNRGTMKRASHSRRRRHVHIRTTQAVALRFFDTSKKP